MSQPQVNGILPSGTSGAFEFDSNQQEDGEANKENAAEMTKLKGQNGPVSLDTVEGSSSTSSMLAQVAGAVRMSASLGENHDGTVSNVATGTEDMESESVASSETNDSNVPGTSQANESLIIPATVDVEKLRIQPENIPRFSPSTSAASTADEESSSADVSGTSTPVAKAEVSPSSILYNILTAKIQNSTENDPDHVSVPVLTSIPGLPHRTPKVLMDPSAVKKTFKCRHCGRLFLKEYDFKQHERCHIEADERPFQCPQCGKRYPSNSKLNIHMRIHTGELPYKCDICDRRFMTQTHLRRHVPRCEEGKGAPKYNCINLLELDASKKEVGKTNVKPKSKAKNSGVAISSKGKESNKSSDDEKVFRCPNCYNIFSNKATFVKHLKEHKEEKAVDGLYTCKKCGKCYERKYNLKVHMKLHDGSAPYACKQCGFSCLRKYNYQMHMDWHRKQKVAKKMGPAFLKKFRCNFCKKSFQNAGHLAFHTKSHMIDKEAPQSSESEPVAEWPNVEDKMSYGSKFSANCPHCKKHYVRKFDLLKHIKIHAKNLKFTCNYCDSTFMTKTNYIKHMQLHTSGEYHMCRSCGLVYSKKVERHRKEKLCWFKTGEALRGLKGEKTSDSDELTTEYWDVMKPDPETCEWCDLAFNSKSNLYTHMRRHSTGHTCQWCGMLYEKKKQQHDRNFNCWLKTREAILKKEREKYQKTGTKPVDLLLGKKVQDQCKDENKQQEKSKVDKNKMDLWRYECQYCDWAFVDSGNRQAHQRRHEEGNHSCRWCGLVYLKKRQKHDRNSRCWLTTREGRLQIAKDGKNRIPGHMRMKTNLAGTVENKTNPAGTVSNIPFKNSPSAQPTVKTLTTLQPAIKKASAAQNKIKTASAAQNKIKTASTGQNKINKTGGDESDGDQQWECDKCDKSFKYQGYLVQHMLIHSEIKPYSCTKCNRSFKMYANLKKHLMNHSFKCEKCLKRFDKEAQYKKHVAEAKHNFKCKQCERCFVRKVALKYHVLKIHGDKAKNKVRIASQESGGGGGKFFCKICGKGFDRTYSLAIHCRYSHKGISSLTQKESISSTSAKEKKGPLSCPKCHKKFAFKSYMERHMKTHIPRPHKCHHCGCMFQKIHDLYGHFVKVHKEKSLTCFKCDNKTFPDKSAFESHLDNHELEDRSKRLSQEAANEFSYSDQSSAEDGWSSEPGTPSETQKSAGRGSKNTEPYQCSTCKKRFKMKGHLVWHQRSRPECATGWKKQTKCRFCHMGFANSARLMIHIKNTHKQKMALVPSSSELQSMSSKYCSLCDITFTQTWSKNRHMHKYHGQQKGKQGQRTTKQSFECRYCGEKSKRLDFHAAHEKLHTENIYKIQCEICMIGFKCIEDLEEHGKAHADGTPSNYRGNSVMEVDSKQPESSSNQRPKQPESSSNQRPKKVVRPHVCRYCNLGFERLSFLEHHEQTHSSESRPYTCQYCGLKFRRLAMLTKHENLKHRDEEETESEGGKPKLGPMVRADDYKGMSPNFTCKACHREFLTQSGWEVHEKKCLEKRGRKPIELESDTAEVESFTEMPQVGTSSESASESDAPGKSSTSKVSQCKTCNQSMVCHKKQYDNCKACRKAEKAAGKEESATDSEKGEEVTPLICNICGQTFGHRNSLAVHQRFHTGSTPFKCSKCDEAFIRKDYLQRHEKRDHGIGLENGSQPSSQAKGIEEKS